MNPSASSPAAASQETLAMSASQRRMALSLVTVLFFMWGGLTCLNDILIPHLKAVFSLSYVEASLIQFTFFGAYFITALPSGRLIGKIGYQGGMICGLCTAGLGALLFYPAASLISYPIFLGALFILATGITILQVAANPYVSALGNPETASSRLNLAQAFNSLGTTIAPFFGGWLILSTTKPGEVLSKATEAATVQMPYLMLAATLFVLAAITALFKLPKLADTEDDSSHTGTFWDALRVPHLTFGAIAIFVYVGAEVSIGSYLINFMADPKIAGFAESVAAGYVSYFWGGAMLGRFVGSALLQKIAPGRMLAFNAAVVVALLAAALLTSGHVAMWAVLGIGFFNSIMFPTIFTLGIANLGHLTSRGSSLLVMAIVGGAIIPVFMGHMADVIGIHRSLFIPAICYAYIIYYGLIGSKQRATRAA